MPSGDVLICPGSVVEIVCNISGQSLLDWRVTQPMSSAPSVQIFENFSLTEPMPFGSLQGINVTIHDGSSVSSGIVSTLTVDTSNYDLSDQFILVRCTGADGVAMIRNQGNTDC